MQHREKLRQRERRSRRFCHQASRLADGFAEAAFVEVDFLQTSFVVTGQTGMDFAIPVSVRLALTVAGFVGVAPAWTPTALSILAGVALAVAGLVR
jgi:hypothetical protein